MTRIIIFFSLALCLAAPLASAQKALVVDRDYIVREAVYFAPHDRLDPHRTFYLDWDPIFRCLYDTPLVCSSKSEVLTLEPRLLTELPTMSDEGRTMHLHFRPDVRFHDDPCFEEGRGRLMTAADFAFVLRRHIDPRTESPYFKPYIDGRIVGAREIHQKALNDRVFDYETEIPGIKVVSATELELKFSEPYPRFAALLAMTWCAVLPREAWTRYGNSLAEHPVGTGPYLYDREASRPDLVVMKPDASYWNRDAGGELGPLPLNAGLRFELITDPAIRSKRMTDEDLSVLDLFPLKADDFLDPRHELRIAYRRKRYELRRADAGKLHYVAFNTKNKILGKLEVRRALSLAVNRDRFIEEFYAGAARKADHFVPPSLPLGTREPAKLDWIWGRHDLARSRELLAEAGYPGGEGLPEFILSRWGDDPMAELETEILKESWAEIGVKVQVRLEPYDDFVKRARQGLHEISINYWLADYPDPDNFFLMLLRSAWPLPDKNQDSPNAGFWSNDRYERLYRESAKLSPGEARGKLYEEMIQLVQSDVPWVFLANEENVFITPPGVEGIVSRSNFSRDYSRVRHMVKAKK